MYERPIRPGLGTEPNGSAPVFTGPIFLELVNLPFSVYVLSLTFPLQEVASIGF